MAIEIERKFLVDKNKWQLLQKPEGKGYRQGYVSSDAATTVRVRIGGQKGFIAIKGSNTGITRTEFEYEIPAEDAEQLLSRFCSNVVSKTRYKIWFQHKLWEVDQFHGENDGLIVAEIELANEGEPFERPDWVTEEVSEDPRYYNANLALFPYTRWNTNDHTWRKTQ